MTYEEALEYAKSYLTVEGVPIRSSEATKCIVEALEKQIPKKVDTGKSRIFGCKLCGYGMDDVYIDDEWNYPIEPMFCPFCGQAIDWSDTE